MRTVVKAMSLAMTTLLSAQVQAQANSKPSEVEGRVEELLSQMTLEEKIDLLGGVNLFDVRGVPRLNVPPLLAADGPFGVRRYARANVIPGGIALAATWNTDLAQRLGAELGRDARARGVHFYLSPGVNIYRAPQNGRNFEYFGEDPYLAARMTVGVIRGVQSQDVAATVKHFFANNSEFARHTIDTVVDERTAREIYLPAFEAAVKDARVGSVMAAYNLVNGEHMTQNRYFNVDVLKGQWGFDGVLMSDWGATYDTAAAVNGGLDLEMPSGKMLNRASLAPLLANGTVTQATLDDKVRRILRTAVRFGWLDRPQLDPTIPQFNARGREVALEAAREAVVLLKNENGVLPLDRSKVRSIAIIGPNAYPSVMLGGGSATVVPFRAISLVEGLNEELGSDAAVHHVRGIPDLRRVANATAFTTSADGTQRGLKVEVFDNLELSGAPASTRIDRSINQGAPLDMSALTTGEGELDYAALAMSKPTSTRWTGYYTPAKQGTYDLFVQLGGFAREIGYRLYVDDKLVADRWSKRIALHETFALPLDARAHKIVLEHRTVAGVLDGPVPILRTGVVAQGEWVDKAAEVLAAQVDAVVLAVGFDAASEAEEWDRSFQLPPGQDELIRKITAANRKTAVVLTSGGATDMNGWIDRVPALLQTWYLGQEAGKAVAQILTGDANPSGKLPATFERRWEDNPVHDTYYPRGAENRVEYAEGVFVGYRGYERRGIQPLFPFGHGLSYSKFRYSDLAVRELPGPSGQLYEVAFTVTNDSTGAGSTVPQLYVADLKSSVERPPKELKGFAKVTLQPGESRRLTLPLDARAFSFYDVKAKQWRAESGAFEVAIGESSANLVLKRSLTLPRTITTPH